MKTIATLLLVSFGVFFCQGQEQLKLSIKKGSDTPNYETEHSYLLELKNLGSTVSNVTISTKNKTCSNYPATEQTEFSQQLQDSGRGTTPNQVVIQPGKTVEFYIKLTRPSTAKRNTWNCTQIVALTNEGNNASNAITIESLIPNPSNNN